MTPSRCLEDRDNCIKIVDDLLSEETKSQQETSRFITNIECPQTYKINVAADEPKKKKVKKLADPGIEHFQNLLKEIEYLESEESEGEEIAHEEGPN